MINIENLVFSTIDYTNVKSYLKIEDDFTLDDNDIKIATKSAKSYVKNYTQLSESELDLYEELIIAVFKIASDFYHNRSAVSNGVNQVFDIMLQNILNNARTYNL